jgi:hypothetical protein
MNEHDNIDVLIIDTVNTSMDVSITETVNTATWNTDVAGHRDG